MSHNIEIPFLYQKVLISWFRYYGIHLGVFLRTFLNPSIHNTYHYFIYSLVVFILAITYLWYNSSTTMLCSISFHILFPYNINPWWWHGNLNGSRNNNTSYLIAFRAYGSYYMSLILLADMLLCITVLSMKDTKALTSCGNIFDKLFICSLKNISTFI